MACARVRRIASSLGLLIVLVLGGCDPRRGIEVPEVDEKQYRLGKQLLRSQQNQVALDAFLKVIDKRDGDAPESHLEAGRIYLTHLSDPYAAIYHFRRYLQIRPNSTEAPMVRQLIETAMKESLKGLPGNALSAEVDRLDLLDMIERLKQENADLRTRLERAGVAVNTPATLAPTQAAPAVAQQAARQPQAAQPRPAAPQPAPQPLQALPVADDLLPVQPPVPVEAAPAQPAPVVRQAPQRPGVPPQPAATAGRTYLVQPRDTLMAISRQFYGTPSRWRDIYEANRDRMRDERDLKIGMELRIP